MRQEIVQLKGSRYGLQLVFSPGTEFKTIRADIQRKLESGSRFFRRGTVIQLVPGVLSSEEEASLRKLFSQHGVLFRVETVEKPPVRRPVTPLPRVEAPPVKEEPPVKAESLAKAGAPVAPAPRAAAAPPPAAKKEAVAAEPQAAPAGEPMLVINRTVRSGQEIRTAGSVLICGNVNAGAQIIAGGSIDIRGTCRGLVHAGADGDTSAFIIADRLMPIQIRIADRIALLPDGAVKNPAVAERACMKDGQITIEPMER